MSLYLIGLGLNNGKSLSLEGLETIKKCSKVYLETYTSILDCPVTDLEALYGIKIAIADRKLIEELPTLIDEAKEGSIALLISGDVFAATTHIDLFLRAKKAGIEVKTIHSASILTAIGITGLQLYNLGKIASIPFENKNIIAPLEALKMNTKNNLHTLFLLDINDGKGMTVKQALDYLLTNGIGNRLCVACCAIGTEKQNILAGKAKVLQKQDFAKMPFPQCLIVPAKKLHFMEEEVLELWGN